MNGIQAVLVLLGALGVTIPFLVVGVGRPWRRQPAARWRSGWWGLAGAVAFASASIFLAFALLSGTAARSSRVGELEATVPWLGRPVDPGGWAVLIVVYAATVGVVFFFAWRRGQWPSLPSAIDGASLRRLVLDGHDETELRARYADQFPGDGFDSIVALAECSLAADRLVKDAGARYIRRWGGLTGTDLDAMIACAHAIAQANDVTLARSLLQRLRTFVARLDAAPVPGKVHWGDVNEPRSTTAPRTDI